MFQITPDAVHDIKLKVMERRDVFPDKLSFGICWKKKRDFPYPAQMHERYGSENNRQCMQLSFRKVELLEPVVRSVRTIELGLVGLITHTNRLYSKKTSLT